MKKRMGYLKLHEEVALDKTGLTVRAYSKQGKYVGRIEISRAGLAAFTGAKGRRVVGNLTWEKFFKRMAQNEE